MLHGVENISYPVYKNHMKQIEYGKHVTCNKRCIIDFIVYAIGSQGTKYVEGSVVVLDSSEVLPTFGIINILDEPYLVCEVLHTEEFYAFTYTSQFLLFSASLMNCQIITH